MKVFRLRTEYLKDPLGIDIKTPRIFWNDEGLVSQSSYEVIATKNGKPFLDTGKVESSSMHYDFKEPFASRDEVTYQVKVWNEKGEESPLSEPAHFEMGLLKESDFEADWISGNYHPNRKKRYPADYFRKRFTLSKADKGRLYISARGVYIAFLNGKRVGEDHLTPGSTDYRKRIAYQTYDVTFLLKEGENTLEVVLGDGWYRGSNGAKGRRNTYGTVTSLFAQMEVKEKDKEEKILSDKSWEWSNDGPIRFDDLKDGEIYDFNLTPTYKGKARVIQEAKNFSASNNVTVKEHERFKPIEMRKTPSGKTLLKFPQNLSGYLSFRLEAKGGEKIHIRLGEVIENGELTLKNIQCKFHGKLTPLQEFTLTLKKGLNVYSPSFFYGGFQYAEIDTALPIAKDDFEAVALYSDFEETSSFSCSSSLVNRFYKNTLRSLKSNSTDIPSDCPTRERMGWTGDSQIFFNTASYMVDYAAFSRKHVQDIFDRQWKSGRLPQIAPYANEDWYMWVMNGSVGWACAGVYIPLRYYYRYGDKRLLEKYYPQMLKYAHFMIKRAGKWGGVYAKPLPLKGKYRKYAVNRGQSYGEWAEPEDVCAFKWYDFASPHPEESTAYTYYTLSKVLEVANILGRKEDKELAKIKRYREGAKKAYQELVKSKKFTLDTDRQAKLVRPLYMGLLDPEETIFAKKRLITALDHYGWRLGTGFLSTPLILDVLSDIDIDYAYRLLLNEKMPGWLYMPKSNATTVWEAWEGNTTSAKGIASLNHYSKGAVCEWLLKTMAGITIQGENKYLLSPRPGSGVSFARGSYDSVYGKVSSSWKRDGEKIIYSFTVPANTTAEVILPSGRKEELGAGTYTFEE